MRRPHLIVLALFAAGAVLGLGRVLAPALASRYAYFAAPAPPPGDVAASIVIVASLTRSWEPETPLPEGSIIARGPGEPIRRRDRWTERTTKIDVAYRSPLDVSRTADIAVRLQQFQIEYQRTADVSVKIAGVSLNAAKTSEPLAIERLEYPIALEMQGPGLEWPVNEIQIQQGTPLPVTEHWTPRAAEPGEYTLRFPLRDINRAVENRGFKTDSVEVTVNGVSSAMRGSDDVTFSLLVTKAGLPAPWFTGLTQWGAWIGAVLGAVAVAFGSAWAKSLLQSFARRRVRSPP